jgi:hypothetical protein
VRTGNQFAAIILGLMLLVLACGGEQAETGEAVSEQADETAGEVTETTDDQVETITAEAVVPVEARAVVESTNGGYTNLEVPVDWSSIGAQQAFVEKYATGSTCRIFIANFDTDENLNTIAREPGQGIIKFTLSLPPDSDPLVGTYDLTCTGSEFTGEAGVMVTGGSTISFVASSMTGAAVEITSVSEDMITGTFQAADNWTSIEGAFQAEIR